MPRRARILDAHGARRLDVIGGGLSLVLDEIDRIQRDRIGRFPVELEIADRVVVARGERENGQHERGAARERMKWHKVLQIQLFRSGEPRPREWMGQAVPAYRRDMV